MSASISHYRVLRVHPDAKPGEVRTAFRRIASETHPDLHPTKAAEYLDANTAQQVLSDPAKKKVYDEYIKLTSNCELCNGKQIRVKQMRQAVAITNCPRCVR